MPCINLTVPIIHNITILVVMHLVSLLQNYSVHGSTGSQRTEYQQVICQKAVRPELVERRRVKRTFAKGPGQNLDSGLKPAGMTGTVD